MVQKPSTPAGDRRRGCLFPAFRERDSYLLYWRRVLFVAFLVLLRPWSTSAQVMLVDEPLQEYTAAPGESYMGTIRLRNTSPGVSEVRLYQTGYLFYADGRALYMAPDSQPRSNAAWLSITPMRLRIAPGDEADISYSVRIPDTGIRPGTYWSMIMVEPVVPAAASPASGVRTVMRVGIQIATHVRGNALHDVGISNVHVASGQGRNRQLVFEVRNNGEAGFRPRVSVELFDVHGRSAAAHDAVRGLMYPGTSLLQRFDVTGLKDGEYDALIVVDTGAPELFGAQVKLKLRSTN